MTDRICPACQREVQTGRFCPSCGTPLGDPLEGRILQGRIQLVSVTSQGPVHSTYEAKHTNGREAFSVKVLAPALADRDEAKRAFLEDSGRALGLMGRLLIPVREMAEEVLEQPDGTRLRVVFTVADPPAGPSLAAVVRRDGPLDPARAAACVRDVLRALASAHASDVVHGDLHPACVFLEPDPDTGAERTRVADTGLSRCLWLRNRGQPPEDPGAAGSDGGRWIAPEQATGEAPGAAADVHAAGLLLYFALTGTTPWHASRGAPLLFEIQRSMPRPPSEIRRRPLPPVLDEVVARALEKDPGHRFRTAEEFAARLDLVAREAHPAASPDFNEDATMVGSLDGEHLPQGVPVRRPAPASDSEAATMASNSPPPATRPRAPSPPPSRPKPASPPRRPSPPTRQQQRQPQKRPRPAPPPPPPGDDATIQAYRRPSPLDDVTVSTPHPARSADETVNAPRPSAPAQQRAPVAGSPPRPPAAVASESAEDAAGRARKGRKGFRLWSVGGPVSVFALTGALVVGGLYAAVWTGYLDAWRMPRWLRQLTGRDPVVVVNADDVVPVPHRRLFVTVYIPATILRPMSGEGSEAVYGRWTLVRNPGADAVDEPGLQEEGGSGRERVYARGEIQGNLGSEGFVRLEMEVPSGTYRCDVDMRFGRGATAAFEVAAGISGAHTERLDVRPDRAVLKVRVIPETGVVILHGPGTRREGPVPVPATAKPAFENRRAVIPGEILFGDDQDDSSKWLYFGETYTVSVTGAEGYKDFSEPVTVDSNPQILLIRLTSDPGGKIAAAKAAVAKHRRLPDKYLGDSSITGDHGVRIALAAVAAREGDWERVEQIVSAVENEIAAAGGDLGETLEVSDLQDVHRQLAAHLRDEAEEAAGRGDRERVHALRSRLRLERLNSGDARSETQRVAAASVRAWLKSLEASGDPLGRSLEAARSLVEKDLVDVPISEKANLQMAVGRVLLDTFAREAWLAAASVGESGERLSGTRAAVSSWLDLAQAAWPDAESELLYKRLRARVAPSKECVGWLLRGTGWKPGQRAVPDGRLRDLPRADRLLLARYLRSWAADTRAEGESEMADSLLEASWTTYATLLDPLGGDSAGADPKNPRLDIFNEEDRVQALFEASRVALEVRGADTARQLIEDYLTVREGDPEARRFRDDLVRRQEERLPSKSRELGVVLLPLQGGLFREGRASPPADGTENPLPGGAPVIINVRRAGEVRVRRFWVSETEVTWAQYKAFLQAMRDPATAATFAHPSEPPAKKQPGARRPEGAAEMGDEEPVRGVDWWDAWACARFLGGRLPTEAEWEMAARHAGTVKAPEDPLGDIRDALGSATWREEWPRTPGATSVFDRAPCGARGFWGGVAEWCLDTFDGKRRASGAVEESVALIPPVIPGADHPMVVRGGSWLHRAPGEAPGSSPSPLPTPPPGPDGKPAPEVSTTWRAMDLHDRRALNVGARVPWVGFRIVYGPDGETPAPGSR